MELLLMAVTLVCLALAIVMCVVGWRLLGRDRQRSDARVEALETAAFGGDPAAWDDAPLVAEPGREAATAMIHSPARRWIAFAATSAVIVGGAGTLFALHRTPGAPSGRVTATPAGSLAMPLELMSLRHAADIDGTFSVTGLVQNPSGARPVAGLIAVVYLFDRDGNYFASGRAALDFSSLQPGDESPFVVRVPAAGGVARYRVTFRRDDGAVVPHVDRRGVAGASAPTTGVAVSTASGQPSRQPDAAGGSGS